MGFPAKVVYVHGGYSLCEARCVAKRFEVPLDFS